MPDPLFETYRPGLEAPARASILMPAGGGVLAQTTRGFHVNTAGSMTLRFEGDTVDRTITVNAGSWYPYRITNYVSGTATVLGMF